MKFKKGDIVFDTYTDSTKDTDYWYEGIITSANPSYFSVRWYDRVDKRWQPMVDTYQYARDEHIIEDFIQLTTSLEEALYGVCEAVQRLGREDKRELRRGREPRKRRKTGGRIPSSNDAGS